MNYLYTINLYNNDKKIHSEQLLSVNNYKTLNTLLVGEDDIIPGEYVVDNGKMLMAVIDMILMEKYCENEPQTITVKNSDGNTVVKLHHPLTNLSALFMRFVIETQKEDELDENHNIMIMSKSVHKLFKCYDLFTNEILSDLFATTDCIDEITGDVKEGFKITVVVEEHE
jgi:hypothetical protein